MQCGGQERSSGATHRPASGDVCRGARALVLAGASVWYPHAMRRRLHVRHRSPPRAAAIDATPRDGGCHCTLAALGESAVRRAGVCAHPCTSPSISAQSRGDRCHPSRKWVPLHARCFGRECSAAGKGGRSRLQVRPSVAASSTAPRSLQSPFAPFVPLCGHALILAGAWAWLTARLPPGCSLRSLCTLW